YYHHTSVSKELYDLVRWCDDEISLYIETHLYGRTYVSYIKIRRVRSSVECVSDSDDNHKLVVQMPNSHNLKYLLKDINYHYIKSMVVLSYDKYWESIRDLFLIDGLN